ncbi:hypothetical protein AB1K09_11260 [Solibacillus silvestris]
MQLSVSILALILSLINITVGRLIVGKERGKVSETSGKNIQRVGFVTLLIIAFSCFYFIDIMDESVMKWFWLYFYTITLGFHLFLDWVFLKETNEYKVSLILLIFGVTYILVFIF